MTVRSISLTRSLRDATRPLRDRLGLRTLSKRLRKAAALRLAAAARRGSSATFVAVTGSSGKSTTVSLLSHILAGSRAVHTQVFGNTLDDLTGTLRAMPKETGVFVAELGVTAVGSMRPMATLFSPTAAIVTKVGLEHYTAFRSREAVAREKGELVAALPAGGLAILNADDANVMSMAARTAARVVTFGWSEGADYRVSAAGAAFPDRLVVEVEAPAGRFTLETPFFGEQFWLASVAAFAAALELGVDAAEATARIASFTPPFDRCGVLPVPGGPTFVVDSVKAPAEGIAVALAAVKTARAPFKRVVIGHISDYAGNPRKQYRDAYRLGREAADAVVFVGENVHRARASDDELAKGLFAGFATTREAAEHIRRTARPGELIFIKGSRNLHLERIALVWTHEVRCWDDRCGLAYDCIRCGLLAVPRDEHGAIRRAERRQRFWGRLLGFGRREQAEATRPAPGRSNP
jgi:UDP-N-acetylmuramoyl-tripeptide--D-alanyl-D-alanine ligase